VLGFLVGEWDHALDERVVEGRGAGVRGRIYALYGGNSKYKLA